MPNFSIVNFGPIWEQNLDSLRDRHFFLCFLLLCYSFHNGPFDLLFFASIHVVFLLSLSNQNKMIRSSTNTQNLPIDSTNITEWRKIIQISVIFCCINNVKKWYWNADIVLQYSSSYWHYMQVPGTYSTVPIEEVHAVVLLIYGHSTLSMLSTLGCMYTHPKCASTHYMSMVHGGHTSWLNIINSILLYVKYMSTVRCNCRLEWVYQTHHGYLLNIISMGSTTAII